MDPQGYFDEV